MVNATKLREIMKFRGITQNELAEQLGISAHTMCRKMKIGVFRSDEIEKIADVLKIWDSELFMSVFFDKEGAKKCRESTSPDKANKTTNS